MGFYLSHFFCQPPTTRRTYHQLPFTVFPGPILGRFSNPRRRRLRSNIHILPVRSSPHFSSCLSTCPRSSIQSSRTRVCGRSSTRLYICRLSGSGRFLSRAFCHLKMCPRTCPYSSRLSIPCSRPCHQPTNHRKQPRCHIRALRYHSSYS